MRSGRTPPFVRPDPSSFSLSNWRIVNGRELQDGDLMEDWDASLTLTCTRIVEIDVGLAIASGRLKRGSILALVSTWWSGGTTLRGSGHPEQFTIDSNSTRKTFDLALSVQGRDVSRHLQLKTALVLVSPGQDMIRDSLAPKRPGSVLWEDSITLVLEGDAPRFPVSVVDFVDAGFGTPNACWRFDWSPTDLSLPAMATMRLHINSRHSVFHDAIVSTNPTAAQVAIRSALKHALANEMLHLAMQHSNELEIVGQHEIGSAGRVFLDLVERLFPGRTCGDCAELKAAELGKFSTEVQAKLGVFTDRILTEAEE